MTEDASNLSEDITNFEVPSVPQYYLFGRTETPEEIAAREAFFTTGAGRLYSYPPRRSSTAASLADNNENAHPAGDQPRRPAEFKIPAAPAPRPHPTTSNSGRVVESSSASSTDTAVEQIEAPNLADLAAFRGPRKPLRRSQLNSVGSNASQGSLSHQQQSVPSGSAAHLPRKLTTGAAAVARSAERRRSASATRDTANNEQARRRSGSTNGRATGAATTATTASSQRVPPAIPRPRGSSLTRPAARLLNSSTGGGVQTRAMAAATSDGVAAITQGISRLNVVRAGTPSDRRIAAATDRLSRPLTRRPVENAPVTVRVAGTVPIRVGTSLRAADRFLAETAGGVRASPSTSVAAAAAPVGGVVRPNSALRKPTSSSIQRLAAPRNRQSADVPSTPKRRFSSALRAYPRDNKPVSNVTIPDTPIFRVAHRASSRAPDSSTAPIGGGDGTAAPPTSASRPPINLSSLVNRLSQPRPQRVAPAADAAATRGGMQPPANPRRIGAVPVGRTHGLSIIRRTTTNTPISIRSRSNSAARVAAAAGAAGGVVQGVSALRATNAAETTKQ